MRLLTACLAGFVMPGVPLLDVALGIAAEEPGRGQGALASWLETVRVRYELAALAAAVVEDGAVVTAGAVGERALGSGVAVTLKDRFHIGSDTKSMTATLAAMLAEEGRLRWDSTVGETRPWTMARLRSLHIQLNASEGPH